MSFWDKLSTFFSSLWGKIKRFLNPLAKEIATSGGEFLLELAKEAVSEAEKTGKPGKEKLEFAIDYVISRLEKEGVGFFVNAVYGAVIAQVAHMNKGK